MSTRPKRHNPRIAKRANAGAAADARYDATTRTNTPELARAQRIRSSARWAQFRRSVLGRHPLCLDPFGDHGELGALAEDVHHIVGLAVDPSLAFVRSNCAPLCRRCHARIEALERAGESTVGRFCIGKDCLAGSPCG